MTVLDDVIASPDDNTARMVYADALQVAGDQRGELIAISCALADLADDDPRRLELARRELALIRGHLPAWAAALGLANSVQWIARGFPDYIEIWTNNFLPIADALGRQVPVTRLYLRGMTRTHCERLCASITRPTLRSLTIVEVADTDCGPEVASALAGSPWLSQLRHLDLNGLPIGDDGLAALITGLQLRNLESLALSSASLPLKLTRKGLASALNAPAFRKLRELRLDRVPLKTSGARCFAKATCADKLETLALTNCKLGAEGARLVLESTALDSLTRLSLRENSLGREASISVGPALAGSLRRLELSANELDDAWIQSFIAERPLALTHLGLRSNLLTISGVRALVESANLAQLESLTVSAQGHLNWGPALESLVELSEFARLRGFDAAHTGITVSGVLALARSPHVRNLRRLALSFNALGLEGARALATSEHLAELECLELGYAQLTDVGIELLCTSQQFPNLRYLNLSNNAIGERGFAALARTTAFPALRVLRLYDAKDPVRRDAIEQHLGAMVDVGDFTGAMGRWVADDELLV